LFGAIGLFLTGSARANVPAGITTSGSAVTITNSGSKVTVANGIVSIVFNSTGSATINQINYTYNNGSGTKTTQMMSGGTDGGMLYWENGGFGTGNTYSVVSSSTNYAELDFLSNSGTTGVLDIHYSMLRGSPGFYVTAIWGHRATDPAMGMGETRTNIYAGSFFNWMSVDPGRNKLMEVTPGNTSISVPGAPVECYLWTSGIYNGRYDDKYKYSADFGSAQYFPSPQPQRVWGWSSVGTGGLNIGLWDVNASQEYYNCGPMKRELMSHIGTTILNMFNGDHYFEGGLDANWIAGEVWTKVYGPYFVYCNNTPTSNTDPYIASQALYNDALAQGVAEASGTANAIGAAENATAWPYAWFNNSAYPTAAQRGTITGQIVISDSGNPNASGSNLYVGVVSQPNTSAGYYDFQTWMKCYHYWTRTDANGNFTIPNVSGTDTLDGNGAFNYTLYAFGPGAPSEFMSQAQTGGNPPVLYNLPATQFSVPVVGGSTTNLGQIAWKPTRVGPTVFEIGYPDRTGRKFRHGDDYWVGDIGPSSADPSSVWSKYLEYPFDFPNGVNYTIGTNHWSTDWNFVQPVVDATNGSYNDSSSTITFNLASTPSSSGSASLYIAIASANEGANIVTINGKNISTISGLTMSPPNPSYNNVVNGYLSAYDSDDTTIREGISAQLNEQRITFPSSVLVKGNNTINFSLRQVGGTYFADHFMYDYIRLEMTGYVPPAPSSVVAYPGNSSDLMAWPVTPGATSYNILRSSTSGSGFSTIATGVTGPVCGSDYSNATWLDTSATNGGSYYYEVQSVNVTGTSSASAQSSAVSPSSGISSSAPAAPAGPTATPGSGEVALSWTASTGADYYIVQRTVLANNGGTLAGTLTSSTEAFNALGTITLSNTTTATSFTDSTPTNGSTYAYTVTGVNAAGAGSASTAVNAVPLATAPTVAPVVTATPGIGEVTLTWNAVPGAVGYVVEYATSPGGPYTLLASVTPLTYVVTGLNDNTTYYFQVVATNSGGSVPSTTGTATTTASAPTNLTTTPGNTQVTLAWSAATGATSYIIERGTVSGGPYTTVGSSIGPAYTDNGLTNGTTYYYVVASVDASGTGAISSEANATPTAAVPVAPTGLTAVAGNAQVSLSWNPSAGATSYVVQEATNTGGPYSVENSAVTGTTYVDTGKSDGITYYYVVAATGTGGTGANSAEANATPVSSGSSSSVSWYGGLSSAWDTATANWRLGGASVDYVDGDTVVFSDTAATSTVVVTGSFNPASVTFNNSALNYTVSGSGAGMISGSTGLLKAGSGTTVLAGTNTFTGQTAILGGTVALGNADGLLESTLDLNNQGGSLSFGALTSSTLGGIEGGQALALTNTSGAAVTLMVGYNGGSTNYSGSLSGSSGSLTKVGAGTLTLNGSSSYAGATTTSGGVLSIGTGALINVSTAAITSGQLQINGGSLTVANSSNITVGSGGLVVNSGTASYNGGLTTDANQNSLVYIGVPGGVLNLASLFIGRDSTPYTSEPTAGSTNSGVYVYGGTLSISGDLNVCNNSGANSSDSVRIDSGVMTVGSTTTITLNNGGRWSVLDVNGGTFTSNDSTFGGIEIGGVFAAENGIFLVRNGTAYVDKITFGDKIQTSGTDVLSVTGGILYVGSGGLVLGGTGAYGYSVSLAGTGTLGALANWSSPLSITLGGDTIQAGDENGNAQNITLTGKVAGSTLTKTGNGMLLLGGTCTLTGATTVNAGVLEISGSLTGTTALNIANGGVVYVAGGLLSVAGNVTNNGIFKESGTSSIAVTGTFVNDGVLDLINAPSTLPPNFVNTGTVLYASDMLVQQVGLSGTTFNVGIESYLEHTYQLQRATAPSDATWTNVGTSQPGTGAMLEFTDPAITGTAGFYRILVSP
jgi:autotransporter-associated beta strand protein